MIVLTTIIVLTPRLALLRSNVFPSCALSIVAWDDSHGFWDNNLKTEYDPINNRQDMFIEHIIMRAKLEQEFN